MTTPTLAFCLGFRNWRSEHLSRCLLSIRRMTTADRIVVCDLGSEPGTLERVRCICATHDATLVSHPAEEWSRSLALNVAARNAGECDYLVLTDADMIFSSRWRSVAIECARPNRLALTPSRDTNEQTDLGALLSCKDRELIALTTGHPNVGQGAACVVPRAWYFKVGGLDEFYKVWGAEDNCLVARAHWDGLDPGWVQSTFVVHQWHRRDWVTDEQWQQVCRNRAYLAERFKERGPVIRNPDGWGGVKG